MNVTLPDGQELVVFAEPGAPAEALPEFAVVSEDELREHSRHGWALRSCLAVDVPLTVYDDIESVSQPAAAAENSFTLPTQARNYYGHDRKARSVVVRQLRFLVQRTRAVDPIEALRTENQRLSTELEGLQRERQQAQRAMERTETDRTREVAKLSEQVSALQTQLERSDAQEAEAKKSVRELRRLLVSHEEDGARLRAVLGDGLMDRLLDRSNTTEAEVLRREVIAALQKD